MSNRDVIAPENLACPPGPRRRIRTDGMVIEAMKAGFSTLQPVWVEGHLAQLCELRRLVGGDLDKPIILAAIGQRSFATATGEPFSYSEALKGEGGAGRSRLTNIESISQATGIPRESVRRKVNEMVAEGWLEKGARGGLMVTAKAVVDLAPATEAGYRMLEDVFEALANALTISGRLKIEINPGR